MLTTLKNDRLTVSAESVGAELQAIDTAEGISYLWNGDPAHWTGHAPSSSRSSARCERARPIRTRGNCTAQAWVLPAGVLSDRGCYANGGDLSPVGQRGDRRVYPYAFRLLVGYELLEDGVVTRCRVKNTGDKPMPFAIGGHPAFRVPLCEGEIFEEYRIAFPEPETADCRRWI